MYESIIKLPFPFLQFLALVAESAKYHGTIFTNGLVLLNLTVIETHEERRDSRIVIDTHFDAYR